MPRSPLFIPETPEELSVEWLNSVLPFEGGEITDTSQTLLGDGEGFVGDIIRLNLELSAEPSAEASVPTSVVAKMPKLANRAMGELLGAYERENMFYMTYANDLPVATPELYYGEFDRDAASEKQEEILRQAEKIPSFLQGAMTRLARWIAASKKRRYILLIEDISSATPIDQVAGVGMEEMARIVADVARLHGHFWQREDLGEQFWLLPQDIDVRMRWEMMVRSQTAFADMFGATLEHGLQTFVDDVFEHGVEYAKALAQGPVTLTHGDLRLDNLFWRDDAVLFIDWQLVRRGNPAYDLAYLFSCGLNGEQSAMPLLARYFDALTELGIEGWSLEQLERDYVLALKVVLMSLSSVDQMDLGDGRGRQMIETWMDRLRLRLLADA